MVSRLLLGHLGVVVRVEVLVLLQVGCGSGLLLVSGSLHLGFLLGLFDLVSPQLR